MNPKLKPITGLSESLGEKKEKVFLCFYCFVVGNINDFVFKLAKSRQDVPSGLSQHFPLTVQKVLVLGCQKAPLSMSIHKFGKFASNEKQKFHFICEFIVSVTVLRSLSFLNMV